jgi:hypothetical protein
MPSSGFGMDIHSVIAFQDADKNAEDPSEFFTMIFGGEAFVDWYESSHNPSQTCRVAPGEN